MNAAQPVGPAPGGGATFDAGRMGGGGALAVDVKSLGRELRRLWETTPEAKSPGHAVLTRACTRNVVVLAQDEAQAARAADVVAGVAGRHPARAFLVCAASGPGDPDRLEAYLEARCLLRGGGRHVCCEQITLVVGEQARKRAAGAIVPLLVPDLPVFVWVHGAVRWDDPLLERLLRAADRLIVDTDACPDPTGCVRELARADRARRWSPGDFAWSRLGPWREAIAAQFDAPDARALACTFDRVCVRVGEGGSPVPGALLAGWALDRIARARELGGRGAGTDQEPVAELEPVAGAPAGAIVSVRFCCDAAGRSREVVVEAGESTLTARLDFPEASGLPSRHPLGALADENLLEDQLDAPASQPVYERALRRAALLLG